MNLSDLTNYQVITKCFDNPHVALLTEECPKVFEDFGVRKKVEKWQFLDKFGRISGSKRSFSVCNTLLHLGILRLGQLLQLLRNSAYKEGKSFVITGVTTLQAI